MAPPGNRRAAAAGPADRADDAADPILLVDLDGPVWAKRKAGAASGAQLLLDLRVDGIDVDLAQRHFGQERAAAARP